MIRVAALAVAVLLSSLSAPRAAVVERFAGDPLSGGSDLPFVSEGDAVARFAFIAGEEPRFPGDRRGTLRVSYDTTLPTARLSAPIGEVLAIDADFEFGAILTIRSRDLAADPDGFSQIAFGLWNAATTGLGRTAWPADTFDLVEIDWFPNRTSFGGPFLAPTVFGGDAGGNAFFNFAFDVREVALPLDEPLLVHAAYTAADRRIVVTVGRRAAGPRFAPIAGASVPLDLSRLSPGFLLNALGIAAYGEGWPSLRAVVDYDLLYTGAVPAPFTLAAGPGPR